MPIMAGGEIVVGDTPSSRKSARRTLESMAERAGAKIVVFPAASHAGGYTHYATPFTKLIEQAAEASVR